MRGKNALAGGETMVNKDFVNAVIEELARRCEEPFEFAMAMCYAGFHSYAEKKKAIQTWNRIHPDKELPLPPKP